MNENNNPVSLRGQCIAMYTSIFHLFMNIIRQQQFSVFGFYNILQSDSWFVDQFNAWIIRSHIHWIHFVFAILEPCFVTKCVKHRGYSCCSKEASTSEHDLGYFVDTSFDESGEATIFGYSGCIPDLPHC